MEPLSKASLKAQRAAMFAARVKATYGSLRVRVGSIAMRVFARVHVRVDFKSQAMCALTTCSTFYGLHPACTCNFFFFFYYHPGSHPFPLNLTSNSTGEQVVLLERLDDGFCKVRIELIV
jgi:hypothetical protein